MTRCSSFVATALALALGLGTGLGAWWAGGAAPPPAPLACRPSAPARAAAPGDAVVLYLGNSLIFDHDWSLPGTLAVNCARQGLTAEGFAPDDLPELAPDMIVLGFGTVELVRAAAAGTVPDAAALAGAVERHLGALGARYPGARVLILEVPPTDRGDPGPLNAALGALAGRTGADWGAAGETRTYDGVHLTAASYAAWRIRIAELLGR